MKTSRQKGMAVIGALIVVAAASAAAANIMERQSLLADTLAGERDRVQAKWLLRGGLDWARVILFNDARNNAVTLKDAIWAQPIAGLEITPPDGHRSAYFSGQIEDEQGKYNLTRLALNGAVHSTELHNLEKLLASLDIAPELAPAIAQRVASTQPLAGMPASAPMLRSLHDLIGLEQITLGSLAILAEYLTVLPQAAALNINTASAEVLSASIPGLDLASARALIEQRNQGVWFTSRGDFLNRLHNAEAARNLPLEVRSEWFKVTGQVTLDHASASLQALLHRQDDGPPTIRWIKD